MKKGKPFLEIFASAVHQYYKFPILELFAFLFALGTFASGLRGFSLTSDGTLVFMLISKLMSISLFIFLVLVFKNVAYGLSGDLERGTIQTSLSYPLRRRDILTAKLLSALGVSFLLFFGIQLTALVVIAPGAILPNIGIVLLTYIANFGYVLFLTAIILLVALFIKRGVISLIVGIVVYFALGIITSIISSVASVTGSATLLQIIALLNPSTALTAHFGFTPGGISWVPTLIEASFYVIGNYVIIASLFFLAYYYFSRRLNI